MAQFTTTAKYITEGLTYSTYTAGTGTKTHLRNGRHNGVVCGSSRKTGYPKAGEVTCSKCSAWADEMVAEGKMVKEG